MVTTYPIDSLTIEGFQSIKDLTDFQLKGLNVLIGANGAGKSNFINYFRMLSEMVEGGLQKWVTKRGGADRVLSFGIKETRQLTSRLQFGDNAYQFTLEPTDAGGFVFVDELLFYKERYPQGFSIGSGYTEARLKNEVIPDRKYWMANYCYASISGWKTYHFHDTGETAEMKDYQNIEDDEYLRANASNIAVFLYRLRHEHRDTYEQIRSTVQLAIPFFDDFVLRPRTIDGANQQVRLLWRQRDSDYPMWPTQLSDGSLRFICLTTALLQPDPPSTIIIDEPELGLHPYAITLLGALMRSASTRMQLIVSTQSVSLLNEFSLDDIIVVEREDGISKFERLKEPSFSYWLEDYSVGEMWEKNIIGGRP